MKKLNVLQFICSSGFYGAERWVLALAKYLEPEKVNCHLAVTIESNNDDLKIINEFDKLDGNVFQLPMSSKFDFKVVTKLVEVIKSNSIDIIHKSYYSVLQ